MAVVLVSLVPIVVLSYTAKRSLQRTVAERDEALMSSATYAAELARTLVEQELLSYFRPRQQSLAYANLEGEEAFRKGFKRIWYTSKLVDFPVFMATSELKELAREKAVDPSHLRDHEVASTLDRPAWKESVEEAVRRTMVAEAARRLGYDPLRGGFAREDLWNEELSVSMGWVEVSVRGPQGGVCDPCAQYVQEVGQATEPEGSYRVYVITFPLPGHADIESGLVGVVAPAPTLLAKMVEPTLGRWREIVARQGSASPTALHSDLRLVDAAGAPLRRVDDIQGASILHTTPLLGPGSPWQLQVYASHDALGGADLDWNLLFALAVSVLLLGAAVLTRTFRQELESSRLHAHLLSNISHELKTPLSLIRLYTDTLEAGRVTKEGDRQKFLGIIGREAKRLTHLIDNLLDIQRIEEDRKTYSYAQVRPDKVVRNTVEAYRFQLTEEGFDLRLDLDDDLPLVMIDEEAVAQALINLLDNAAKYSDTVKEIRVRCAHQDGAVRISVQDRGIGIPAREQDKIFQSFYRVEKSLVHDVKGSGLGLAVVAHVAAAHGGTVAVDSTPGKGSTFTLVLPVDFAPEF